MKKDRNPKPALGPQDLEDFKAILIERKKLLRARVDRLSEQAGQDNPRASGEISSLPIHLADLGSDTTEQDQDLSLAERGSDEISQIDQALDRIAQGEYGICERCSDPIPLVRLQAIPHTALCTACQARLEAA